MNKTDIRILKAIQTVFPASKLEIYNAKQEDIDKLKREGIKGIWRRNERDKIQGVG